jgi:hypothetical protein
VIGGVATITKPSKGWNPTQVWHGSLSSPRATKKLLETFAVVPQLPVFERVMDTEDKLEIVHRVGLAIGRAILNPDEAEKSAKDLGTKMIRPDSDDRDQKS